MKKTILIFILCQFGVVKPVCAQTSTREEPPRDVSLSINLETNVATIGFSVLNLTIRVKNTSTNWLAIPDEEMTTIFLTNGLGHYYEMDWLLPSDFDRRVSHGNGIGVKPDSTNEWSVVFKISKQLSGKEVTPGAYTLKASHEVFSADKISHKLVSNSLNLRLEGFEDTYSWGAVEGAQFSINMDTNVVLIGATNHLSARIRNLSTNEVAVLDVTETSLSLTDKAGHVYELSRQRRSDWDGWIFQKTGDVLRDGDIKEWPLAFTIDKQIGGKHAVSDIFTLKAAYEVFTADNKSHKLASNSLQVQLK